MHSRFKLGYWLIAIGFICGLGGLDVSAAEKVALRRWAIVSSKEVQREGLSDLLTASLSRVDGIELVERDSLDRAIKELEVSTLSTASASSKRLALGRVLKADALLLLSVSNSVDGKRFFEIVVSDCNYGARLRSDFFSYDVKSVDALAGKCVQIVERTRNEFADGIKHLICVTDFLSKNLRHEFDHLQSAYASLLANSLAAHPGVAVVEIDEARAIDREMRLAGSERKSQIVPLFVEGEFVHRTDGVAKRMLVKVKDFQRNLKRVEREDLSESHIVGFLSRELPNLILDVADGEKPAPLSRGDQANVLTARANLFTQLGSYENSARLREAALLLKPSDTLQRLELIADYGQLQYQKYSATHLLQSQEHQRRRVKVQMAMLALMRPHVELLIRRRELNQIEAGLIVTHLCSITQLACNSGAPELQAALDDFYWRTVPLIPGLNCQTAGGVKRPPVYRFVNRRSYPNRPLVQLPRESQYFLWSMRAISYILNTSPESSGHRRNYSSTLDYLTRFLTDVVSQSQVSPYVIDHLTNGGRSGSKSVPILIADGRLSPNKVRTAYLQIRKSGKPMSVFYARCGLLALDVFASGGKRSTEERRKECDELIQFVKDHQVYKHFAQRSVEILTDLRKKIDLKTDILAKKDYPFPPDPFPPVDPTPRVTFEPVGGIATDWVQLLKCSDSLDVMWSLGGVSMMMHPGQVKSLYVTDAKVDPIQSVACDGKYVWVATSKSGIQVISRKGGARLQIDSRNGLPPYESKRFFPSAAANLQVPLLLYAISPGQCLATAWFGKNKRQWFARLSLVDRANGLSPQVDVFHTTTSVVGRSPSKLQTIETENDKADRNVNEIFSVSFFLRLRGLGEDHSDLLLIGRQRRFDQSAYDGRPLAINLATWKVSVYPHAFLSGPGYRDKLYLINGQIITVSQVYGVKCRVPSKQSNSFSEHWLYKVSALRRKQESILPVLLPFGGQLYNPGRIWRRIDPKTHQLERLTDLELPLRHRFEYYGVSAHYGLVAWNRGDQLYRVILDAQSPKDISLGARHPNVPSEKRQTHHSAVLKIRELGGSVDTVWTRAGWLKLSEGAWRTVAFLGERWKGSDTDLTLLQDLHNLQVLCIVRNSIGDDGIRQIRDIQSLRCLALIDSKVTNAGLRFITNLGSLEYLRLEIPSGFKELGDRGLEHVVSMPIGWLELNGPGFTNECLEYLMNKPKLYSLRIAGTSVTKDGLARLKQSRSRGFSIVEETPSLRYFEVR